MSDMINRLYASFNELENSIRSARQKLVARNASQELLARLDQYDGILAKERSLAKDLEQALREENLREVHRNVTIINELSAMIREDALDILKEIGRNGQ